MFPKQTNKMFGSKYGSNIYGVVYQGFMISNWVTFFVVKDLKDSWDYDKIFYLYLGGQVVAFVVGCFMQYDIKWSKIYTYKHFLGETNYDKAKLNP